LRLDARLHREQRVGAAVGCDLLILFLIVEEQIKGSQPAASPTREFICGGHFFWSALMGACWSFS
jgi:hypothetical protein